MNLSMRKLTALAALCALLPSARAAEDASTAAREPRAATEWYDPARIGAELDVDIWYSDFEATKPESDLLWVWNSGAQDWMAVRQSSRAGADAAEARGATQEISGSIAGFQKVQAGESSDAHTLVKVRLRDGASTIADLGRSAELAELGLDRGDSISLRGRTVQVAGRSLLLAQQITVDGKTREIARNQAAPRAKRYVLKGVISDYRQVRVKGESQAHTLVRLQLENGRTALVDLGSKLSLADLGADRGDRIAVLGRKLTINDKPVLGAQQVRLVAESARRAQSPPGAPVPTSAGESPQPKEKSP